LHITDFVSVPEDFIIENHMGMRERMGFFKYPDLISLERIKKMNAVVKTTGYVKITMIDCDRMHEEMQAVASAAAYLICLYEVGLIVESFKKISFKSLWGNVEGGFDIFISNVKDYNSAATVHIINIFPLIQNSKLYLESAIQNLLKLDDIELDRQESFDRIGNLD